jgi:transposase
MVHARRMVVNAIVYVNRTGCAWRYLPNDFRPGVPSTAISRWRDDGALQLLHDG